MRELEGRLRLGDEQASPLLLPFGSLYRVSVIFAKINSDFQHWRLPPPPPLLEPLQGLYCPEDKAQLPPAS